MTISEIVKMMHYYLPKKMSIKVITNQTEIPNSDITIFLKNGHYTIMCFSNDYEAAYFDPLANLQ